MEQSGAEFYGGQEWEVRQAELAERYEAPLVTVDSAGEAITGCARCPDFCRVIMVNPVSRRGCQAHCAALAAEALRLGGVAAALCPCGLYTGALPLPGTLRWFSAASGRLARGMAYTDMHPAYRAFAPKMRLHKTS